MGGLSILITLSMVWMGLFLFGRLTPSMSLIFSTAVACGLIGLLDDGLKFWKKNSAGLAGRYKLLLLLLVAGFICWMASDQGVFNAPLHVPFVATGWLLSLSSAITIASFVLIGTVNAVNFNDGLDGLAIGTVLVALVAFAIVSYHQSQTDVFGLIIMTGSVLLGFLWWNAYPAHVFLGDAGSFMLGGLLAAIAITLRAELFLPFIAFVPMVEVITVMIQVTSFKLLRKRVFKVAPVHHHFEHAKGVNYTFLLPNTEWPEPLITLRFWIVATVMALIGLVAYH
jgi:phospho-N-acetylmuramoyl-pentapeptide-transferase